MSRLKRIIDTGKGWSGRLPGLMTPKRTAVLLSVLYVLSLAPLLWISRYNYPSADDYTNGDRCRHVWENGHSIFSVLGEAVLRTVDEWLEWRGCFTSSLLSAVTPNVWGEKWYFLTTWIVLITLSFSVIYLFRMIFSGVFGADKYTSHSIAMLTLFLTVQCVDTGGRVEGFFWYSGAINYVFIHGMSLIFYGLLLSLACNKEKRKCGKLAVSCVLGFLVGGGNQMTMLNVAIVLFIAVAVITVEKKWKNNKACLFPIVSFYLGAALSIIAPGNYIRAGSASGMDPVRAIMISLYYGLDLALSEWLRWPLVLIIFMMVPVFWNMARNIDFSFPCPLGAVFLGYGIVSAMVTPPLFAVGNIEAGRLQALFFMMYVLVSVLCTGYVTGWARKRVEGLIRDSGGKPDRVEGSIPAVLLLSVCLVFFLFASMLTVIPEPHYYTFISALTDLKSGEARAYGEARRERARLYAEGAEGELEVEAIEEHPSLLYFNDITEDAQDWANQGVARFYGLEAVKVRNTG